MLQSATNAQNSANAALAGSFPTLPAGKPGSLSTAFGFASAPNSLLQAQQALALEGMSLALKNLWVDVANYLTF